MFFVHKKFHKFIFDTYKIFHQILDPTIFFSGNFSTYKMLTHVHILQIFELSFADTL